MMRALYISASGMEAQQLNIDIISNNLANVNTSGFKKSRGDFQDLLYQTIRMAGAPSGTGTQVPAGIQIGSGVRSAAVQKIFTQGDFQNTQNSLDLAIEGEGFFQVSLPDGTTGYTRAGAFKKDNAGRMVTSDGYTVEPAITIPADTLNITVSANGIVSVLQAGNPIPTEIGTIQLTRFSNPSGLNSIGRNLFLETAASGEAVTGNAGELGFGTLAQGFLESSNVNIAEELVNMIIGQRAYEINSKAIQTADDMMRTSNELKR
ncbi:MAG: flagellar basal-body rod protein FlgG [Nitrospirae bacterium RIFCSPLOWO2_02_42_7]|nr:MAG: flagellar basal-body rod protein FlgG [Nitrospirae bacterium RIFCSPLOWO2_02_42_7]